MISSTSMHRGAPCEITVPHKSRPPDAISKPSHPQYFRIKEHTQHKQRSISGVEVCSPSRRARSAPWRRTAATRRSISLARAGCAMGLCGAVKTARRCFAPNQRPEPGGAGKRRLVYSLLYPFKIPVTPVTGTLDSVKDRAKPVLCCFEREHRP